MIVYKYDIIDFSIPVGSRKCFSQSWSEVRATHYCVAWKIRDESI